MMPQPNARRNSAATITYQRCFFNHGGKPILSRRSAVLRIFHRRPKARSGLTPIASREAVNRFKFGSRRVKADGLLGSMLIAKVVVRNGSGIDSAGRSANLIATSFLAARAWLASAITIG